MTQENVDWIAALRLHNDNRPGSEFSEADWNKLSEETKEALMERAFGAGWQRLVTGVVFGNTGTSLSHPPCFTHEEWEELLTETFATIRSLAKAKGGEYSGDSDRLANFRRNGTDLGVPMEVIWRIYAAKHWDALGQYVRDCASGTTRVRLEPLSGRVDDLIVYLLLFKAMLREKGQD